jgi:hypothetical protein
MIMGESKAQLEVFPRLAMSTVAAFFQNYVLRVGLNIRPTILPVFFKLRRIYLGLTTLNATNGRSNRQLAN